MPRVLLLLPTTSYRTPDLLEAARRLGLEVTVASEAPSALEGLNPEGLLRLDFHDPEGCARAAADFSRRTTIDAVVGVDEDTAVAAAVIARALGLRHNPVSAVVAARHKGTLRALLAAAGVPSPAYRLFPLETGEQTAAREVSYPCVLKPTFLAGSRGVIRADDREQFVSAWRRIERILRDPEVARKGREAAREILVEDFVPGGEVALEGLLEAGELSVLALFDKPDPLDGPFFEETIYVTPSRLPRDTQAAVARVAARGALALGLREGPVHAELRLPEAGPSLIEIAARSIGGLCSRALRFGTGMSLEEIVLRQALGLTLPRPQREARAAGVMMIPIAAAGVFERVEGMTQARAVPDIDEVVISAHPGQWLIPPPEGWRYLGFLFSRAESPQRAEAALREAHGKLRFEIRSA